MKRRGTTRGAWRISRRKLLRGAGVALALPALEVMSPARRARAVEPAVSRFITWFRPGGCVAANWFPSGGERDFVLGKTLAALEPFRSKLVIFSGLDYKVASASAGHPHYRGLAAFLTGNILRPGTLAPAFGAGGGSTTFAQGPSLDQVIAPVIRGGAKLNSLDLNVRDNGPRGANPSIVSLYDGANQPRAPIVNPAEAWDTLFKDLQAATTGDGLELERLRARRRSVLDVVLEEYRLQSQRASVADRAALDHHATRIRAIETQLVGLAPTPAPGGATSGRCRAPERPASLATTGGSMVNRMGATSAGGYSSANIPKVGRVLTDILVMALACDLTRVANLQWLDPVAFYGLDFVGFSAYHHFYQHAQAVADASGNRGGYRPNELTTVETWYMSELAYLLGQLDSIREPDGSTLLDGSLVYSGSEISEASNHDLNNIPFILAGGLNGRVRTGRYLKYAGRSHIDLLVAIQNLFGVPAQTFGHPGFTAGALPGLS